MHTKRYEGDCLRELRLPLGGIGAGCLSLNGAGRLVDWEIAGVANKNTSNGMTHFAIKAVDDDGQVWARALQGDEPGSRMGDVSGKAFGCYGFGQPRETLGGLPHFPQVCFDAAWPVARLSYAYEGFPGQAELTAFSPFVPLRSDESSLPAALFRWAVTNTGDRPLTYTVCLSLTNPLPADGAAARYLPRPEGGALVLENFAHPDQPRQYGAMGAAVWGAGQVSHQVHWYRGAWFDGLNVFWKDFNSTAPLPERRYGEPGKTPDTSSIALTARVEPGQTWNADFALAWYYPILENDWAPPKPEEGLENRWRKHYAVRFPSVEAVLDHVVPRREELWAGTERFVAAVTDATLPEAVRDAALSTLSTLVTPLTLRLPDGSFYGWEGLHTDSGCCEGSCTHVWNYAYALCYLFPDLERSMRDLDFTHNMDEHGGMRFRLQLPVGRKHWDFLPCADGQFGGVIKLWRDYLLCGDREWLRGHWPRVKKMIAYAWSEHNDCRWDPEKTGVLTGRQHHTLDMELFGPNSWLTGMYLAALKAAARMAAVLGDEEAQAEYEAIFARGSAWAGEHLFNGEYFYHRVDIDDKSTLAPYHADALIGLGIEAAYWDEEHGELKYQIGEGSSVDQVLGQWHANLSGLGDIYPREKVQSALQSIHRYNFVPTMRDFFNPCRLYCVNDEGGTLICAYPEGRRRPVITAPYSEETMHGFEYSAASHLVQEGMVDEAVEMVSAVRSRYDGRTRNPFNEVECGSNYARSMAAFSLLPSFLGFTADLGQGILRFAPVVEGPFRCPFAAGTGWGIYERDEAGRVTLTVLGGSWTLQALGLTLPSGAPAVTLDGHPVPCAADADGLRFAQAVEIHSGQTLALR